MFRFPQKRLQGIRIKEIRIKEFRTKTHKFSKNYEDSKHENFRKIREILYVYVFFGLLKSCCRHHRYLHHYCHGCNRQPAPCTFLFDRAPPKAKIESIRAQLPSLQLIALLHGLFHLYFHFSLCFIYFCVFFYFLFFIFYFYLSFYYCFMIYFLILKICFLIFYFSIFLFVVLFFILSFFYGLFVVLLFLYCRFLYVSFFIFLF